MNNVDNYDNYFKIEKIGIGGGGNSVYIVKNLNTGKKFALKKIIINNDCPEEMQGCLNEINIFKQLNHPYLIKYEDSFLHKNKICIIMEYAEDKDLETKIKNYKSKNLKIPENEIWKYFLQIISGISYLHSNKIIHRDIKGQNILLSKGNVKIGDFGTSKRMENTNSFTDTSLGTPLFLSPEICKGKPYNFKSDNWMIGCVLFQLMNLEYPFKGNNLPILMKHIIENPIPEIIFDYSDELKFLVKNLLKKNMDERISINDILNRPFVKEKIKSLNIYFDNNHKINNINYNNFNVSNIYNINNNNNQIINNNFSRKETIEEKSIKMQNQFHPIVLIKHTQNINNETNNSEKNNKKKITQISINQSNSDAYTGPTTPKMCQTENNSKHKINHMNSNFSLNKNNYLNYNNAYFNQRGISPNKLNINKVKIDYSLSPIRKRKKTEIFEVSFEENEQDKRNKNQK